MHSGWRLAGMMTEFELQKGHVAEVVELKGMSRCKHMIRWLDINFSRHTTLFLLVSQCLPK